MKVFDYSKFCNPVPHRIVIFTKKKSNSLRKYLNKFGIGVRTLFVPMHRQPIFNRKNKFENSEGLFNTGICLPSAPSLTSKQIDFICNTIKKFYDYK